MLSLVFETKILVVERAGVERTTPIEHLYLGRDSCIPCAKGSVGDCKPRGAVYEIFCRENDCGRN